MERLRVFRVWGLCGAWGLGGGREESLLFYVFVGHDCIGPLLLVLGNPHDGL